jgi:hypothetical protein
MNSVTLGQLLPEEVKDGEELVAAVAETLTLAIEVDAIKAEEKAEAEEVVEADAGNKIPEDG